MTQDHPAAHQLYLRGRKRSIGVCCASFDNCTECLERIAGSLAWEIGNDVSRAMDRPAEQYAAEIDGTPEQGCELRRLTVRHCLANGWVRIPGVRVESIGDLVLADSWQLVEVRA